jgi:hypothetical protein
LADIATSSHIVTSLSLDEKGKGTAELRILPTPRGKTIQTLIRNNAQLGVSIRGFGDVGKDGVVANSYKLVGLDVVLNPSFKGAFFDKSNIFESEFSEEKEDKNMKNLMGLSQEYVDEMMDSCYEVYVRDEDFKGSFEDFKKEEGRFVFAAILLEQGKFEDISEALKYLDKNKDSEKQTNLLDTKTYLGATEMGFKGTWQEWETLLGHPVDEPTQKLTEEAIQAKIMSFFNEAISSGFRGTISEFKKKFPAIVEQASEVKIVEKKEETRKPFKSKCSWAEIQLSGYKGTIKEYQEQFSNIEIIPVESAQKEVVVEEILTEKTLKEEAGRIFVALKNDNPDSSVTLESVIRMLKIEEEKKIDKRILKKAIAIVSRDMFNSGGGVSEEKMEKMVKAEVQRLQEERKLRREKNWQCYKKLLSD